MPLSQIYLGKNQYQNLLCVLLVSYPEYSDQHDGSQEEGNRMHDGYSHHQTVRDHECIVVRSSLGGENADGR